MNEEAYNLISIIGPTASGKTSLAARLAKELGTCVISADSRQVYKGMDIGTGKDLADFIVDGEKVPFELIDICEAGSKYNVYQYQQDFQQIFISYLKKGNIPVLCGGSGLYIESVLKSYQMQEVPINEVLRLKLEQQSFDELADYLATLKTLHNKSDFDTKKRLIRAIEIEIYRQQHPITASNSYKVNSLIVAMLFDRQDQKQRITERLHSRLKEGMIDEVKMLLEKGISPDDLIYYGLEYKFITQYITGVLSYEKMVELLNIAIHQFSKRQNTWFRKMERDGIKIHWIDGLLPMDEKLKQVFTLL